MTFRRPQIPGAWRSKDDNTREDFRRVRVCLEQFGLAMDDLQNEIDTLDLTVGGDASGTIGNMVVNQARGLRETAGPTTLSVGAVADGQVLFRSGNTIIGSDALPTATAAQITATIAPKSWWRADNTVQSGGLVDTIVDNGSFGKNMTQTGAQRCPTAVDGNGKTYLAFDGAADYYQPAAANDWKFMNDGSPNTIAIIMAQPTLAIADQTLLGNVGFDPAVIGFELLWSFVSATEQGPSMAVSRGTAGQLVVFVEDRSGFQPIQVFIFRCAGEGLLFRGPLGGTPGSGANTLQVRRHGCLRSTSYRNVAFTFNNANPTSNIALGARKTGGGVLSQFSSARIYDVILDNKIWSDDFCLLFERYARGKGCVV